MELGRLLLVSFGVRLMIDVMAPSPFVHGCSIGRECARSEAARALRTSTLNTMLMKVTAEG
jgi:hypothetical protein